MPAVQLSQLKNQIDLLGGQFSRPPEFCRAVIDLFNLYADLTYKAGDSVEQPLLIPTYRVPQLVIRQLELAAASWVNNDPISALQNADFLWDVDALEAKTFAAYLMGHVSTQAYGPIIQRIQGWCSSSSERLLNEAILAKGSYQIRKESSAVWLETINEWFSANTPSSLALGLSAMITTLEDPRFENIPAVYKLLSQYLPNIPDAMQNDLQKVVVVLVQRAPAETSYYLKQLLTTQNTPLLTRVIRLNLPAFPPTVNASMKSALSNSKRPSEKSID